jgi:tetratricopeptide (TPR) repeat protein
LRALARDGDFVALARRATEDAERVGQYLAEIAGASDLSRAGRLDRVAQGDELQRAFIDFVSGWTKRAPLALLLEDAHNLDLASLKLVRAAMSAAEDLPLFVAIFSREDIKPFEGGLRLALSELTPRACRALAKHLLPAASEDTIEQIVVRSAGNPLMLEELARSSSRASTPETVLSMMEARIAELDPETRRVLRAASVLGVNIDVHAIVAILGDVTEREAARALEEAREREILQRAHGGLVFRQQLMREAAYGTLTAVDRTTAHGRAARWLEQNDERDPVRLAEHWMRGGRPDKAIPLLVRGAERALMSSDTEASIALADRAIACGATGQSLGLAHLYAAEALAWQARYEEARARAEVAMSLLREGSSSWLAAATEAIVASGRLGDEDGIVAIAHAVERAPHDPDAVMTQMVALARAASALVFGSKRAHGERLVQTLDMMERATAPLEAIARARVEEARANLALAMGDPGSYVARMATVASAFEMGGALRAACMTRMNLGHVLTSLGAWEASVRTLESALESARVLRVPFLALAVQHNLGLALAQCGRLEEAERIERAALDGALDRGDARLAGACRVYLARISLMAGNATNAVEMGRLAARDLEPHPALLALAEATLALALLQLGDRDEAHAAADRSFSIVMRLGDLEEGDILVRLVRAETLMATGRDARAVLEDARARIEAQADRLPEELRDRWLAVPENARVLALCR